MPCTTHTPVTTHGSDILSTPLSEQCGVQTDFSNADDLTLHEGTTSLSDFAQTTDEPPSQHPVKREVLARPRPRPRSKAIFDPVVREEDLDQPMTREVKVQTLVRLKDDGAESVFAGFTDSSSDISSNKYLKELLDAFGDDEQGFQEDQDSESDQSEKSEDEKEEEEEVAASESCVSSSSPPEPLEPLKRPEPRPRTRNPKPMIAPKPSELMPKEQETPSGEKSKETLNAPVPAPRPLLTKKSSKGNKIEKNRLPRPPRPPVAARRSVGPSQAEEAPSGHQAAAVPPKPSVDDQKVDDEGRNSSPTPVKKAPVSLDNRSSGKCEYVFGLK